MKKLIYLIHFLAFILLLPSLSYCQIADFSVDDTLGCSQFTVQFTNEGSTGGGFTYEWDFGGDGTSTDENPLHTFNNGGIYPVRLVVTNTSTSETDEITKNITVIQTPTATLTIDKSNACVNGNVEFRTGGASKDSAFLDFDDGSYSKESDTRYIYHAYTAHGTYNVQFITYYKMCSDTSFPAPIVVDGPIADFTMSDYEACKGSPITFTISSATTDVDTYFWDVGEGNIILTGSPAIHSYDTMGYIIPELHVDGAAGSCIIDDTIHIFIVRADFTYPEEQLCDQDLVFFQNTSTGDDDLSWNFGNGNTSIVENPTQTFSSGSYNVSLKIFSDDGCTDSTIKIITINDPPFLQMSEYAAVCPGGSVQIQASGGHVILWNPPDDFDDPTSYTPTISPLDTSTYIATITDTVTHCINSDSITIVIQGGLIAGEISVFPTDSNIIIGDTVAIYAYDSLNRNIIAYSWTPEDGIITCSDCPNPVVRPLQTTTYTLVVSDTNMCYVTETFDVYIEVREEYRIGLPDAFTPNGDGINDIIKVDGWGIKDLIEIRIYNRWGNEVFYSDDINSGWDGYYKGKLQSIDSYAYVIKAEMWDENITVKQGSFSLLR